MAWDAENLVGLLCFLDKSRVNFHIFLKASSGIHIVFHRGGLSKKILLIIRLSSKTNQCFLMQCVSLRMRFIYHDVCPQVMKKRE